MIIKQEKNMKMNMEKKNNNEKGGIKLSNQIKWEKNERNKTCKNTLLKRRNVKY